MSGTSLSPQEQKIVSFKHELARRAKMIAATLPAHIPYERYERALVMAVQKEPDLLNKCSPGSLMMACADAAADGLLPNKREGAIVPFKGEAKWMPMVAGIMKLARNSGQIASLTAQVVYEGEKFHVSLGDDERIDHERDLEKTGGKVVAAYAIARLKDGSEPIREVMSRKQLDKVRNVNSFWSKGPWKDWDDEMCRKSVIRRLSKKLPLSTDRENERLQTSIDRIDAMVDLTPQADQPQIAADDDFAAAAHGVEMQQIAAPNLIERLTQMQSLEQVQEIEPQVSQAIHEADERGDSDAANALDAALQSALSRTSTAKESMHA